MLTPTERLIRLRTILGLSQREMAKEFKVSAGAVGSWEVGEREIPGPVLKLVEIYEQGLNRNLEARPATAESNVQAIADDLVTTITQSMRITDSDLLSRLNHALCNYMNDTFSSSSMKYRLQGLALKQLIKKLSEARGLPMKVAQIAAFLDPKIPLELREIFASLQNQGRAMSIQAVHKVLREEFDCGPEELFAEFSRQPAAAASIGQVHRARLHDGTCVAVKVQYPEIQSQCVDNFRDLEFVQQLSLFIGSDAEDAQELLKDFQKTVLEECDFEKEAESQDRFARIFVSDPEIVVPEVYFSHSRKRVLTTRWSDGQTWEQFRNQASQFERNKAAHTISRFYAQSAFVHGLVHADPHPGNYIFLDGKVAFLDFGRVKAMTASTKRQLHSLHHLLLCKDREKTRAFVETSDFFRLGPKFEFENFWNFLNKMGQHLHFDGEVLFSRDLLSEQRSVLKQLRKTVDISASPDFFWILLFTHTLMISGRADLGAIGNWREILKNNMSN
jgi:transcriptional regulator with XRE-family HTH domain/tRNA A-37 threonylcarbamoyl transferase component Bud32